MFSRGLFLFILIYKNIFILYLYRYKNWGGKDPHRTTEDVAFAVARFFQKEGTFQNYYMVKNKIKFYNIYMVKIE